MVDNNEPVLIEAIQDILKANAEFRAGMPDDWDGDPLQDACDTAAFLLVRMGVMRRGAKHGESPGRRTQETAVRVEGLESSRPSPDICGCLSCQYDGPHDSDCAVHNAPALPVGTCDCRPPFNAEERGTP